MKDLECDQKNNHKFIKASFGIINYKANQLRYSQIQVKSSEIQLSMSNKEKIGYIKQY